MPFIETVDCHTAGESTRVALSGQPDLGTDSLRERLHRFAAEHDSFRSAVVNEPRGSDVLVGALLLEPTDPGCAAEVIFFNNVGYLGMCGHGRIGLVTTLTHLGRIQPGEHRIETPVGVVRATSLATARLVAAALTGEAPAIAPERYFPARFAQSFASTGAQHA